MPQEKLDLYNRVLETYKQEININPDYPFKDHCAKWNVKERTLNSWLCKRGIFVSVLKQKARERLTENTLLQTAQKTGAFVSVHPEPEAMSGWRNTVIPRVVIYFSGNIRLSVKRATAADVIALISTYAEKGGR